MKDTAINFLKQHLPAIVIFIALSFFYFIPALSGMKLMQHDVIQSLCMQGEINRYLEKGDYILWVNNMFSGMPGFALTYHSMSNLIGKVLEAFYMVFVEPTNYLVMGMAGVYIFCLTLQVNRWLAIIAAIAFAFSSFNIISIEAGHTSKVGAMALAGPLLAGVLVTYRRNLIQGLLLTVFFAALQVRTFHVQITFYIIIAAAIVALFELYRHVAEKETAAFFKKSGLLLCAGALALACNTSLLWPTYEYSKETMRGGGSELKEKAEQKKGGGLSKDYAFSWSQGITECFTFIVPGFSGGSSSESLGEDSHSYETLVRKGVSPAQAKRVTERLPTYWGNQPFTAGPIYLGATVVFLFLFGFLISGDKLKWALLAAIILALMLSWGKNFSTLSYFFFDYVPLYNKFRTPSMWVSIIMLLVPVTAVLGINELLKSGKDKSFYMKHLKISGAVMLGLCAMLWLGASMFSFSPDASLNNTDKQYFENYDKIEGMPGLGQEMLDALKDDRKSMMQSDALRSLVFIALVFGLLFLYVESKIKLEMMAGGIALLVLVDLWQVDKRYLNDESFVSESDYKRNFQPRAVDLQILRDPELHFRVHDITSDPFNNATVSNNLKTIGGYNAAKMQRYQDMIEKHISKGNMNVLNMLNAKYFIVRGDDGQAAPQTNPGAQGNAWAVQHVQWVKDADEEINALEDFNPDSTVVIDERYRNELSMLPQTLTGNATVQLTSYHPDKMVYSFESETPQMVVFSEMFYNGNKDWVSFIDGKEANHERVNYILRGMSVPAGKHEIVFEFKPKSFYTGEKISLAANMIYILLLAGYAFQYFRKNSEKK
jgi:hypothetical protein